MKLFALRLRSVALLTFFAMLMAGGLASCSSGSDRVDKEIERYNKSLPKKLGEGLTLKKVSREGGYVVMDIGYNGYNEPIAIATLEESRDQFGPLFVGTLNRDTKDVFTSAGLGLRVIVTGDSTRCNATFEVPVEELRR